MPETLREPCLPQQLSLAVSAGINLGCGGLFRDRPPFLGLRGVGV